MKDFTNPAWDPEKKAERDALREQAKAKKLIGHIYESFKAELCSKPRTRKEVIAHLYKFQEAVLKEAQYLRDNKLEDFTDMTVDIIEKKIAVLITAQITANNTIRQHVPATEVVKGAFPKTAKFKTKEELLAVDFVKHFTEQAGFAGFTWKTVRSHLTVEIILLAHYATGDAWMVGVCVNDVGLDDLPEESDEPGSTPQTDKTSAAPSSPGDTHPPTTPQ